MCVRGDREYESNEFCLNEILLVCSFVVIEMAQADGPWCPTHNANAYEHKTWMKNEDKYHYALCV